MMDTSVMRMMEEMYQPRMMNSLVLVVLESKCVISRAKIEVARRAMTREMAMSAVSLVNISLKNIRDRGKRNI